MNTETILTIFVIIAAFLLVTALIVFFPTTNKGFAMSMNMAPSSIARLLP